MDYNTSRSGLILPEYGRNIHKMVDQIKSVPNKEKRNKMAKTIINTMGLINPSLKSNEGSDAHRKLWDHLYIMSNFSLDVDSPYPPPSREQFVAKPKKVLYPKTKIKYRYYGKMMEEILARVHFIKDEKDRNKTLIVLANQMKKLYLTWNRDSVTDELIWSDMQTLVNQKTKIPEGISLADFKEPTPKKIITKKKGRVNQRRY